MMTMKQQTIEGQFVAVTDAEEAKAGAQVWWTLRGECDRAKLVAELAARGIQHMPKVVEPETAIRRAVACLRGKRRLVRPLKRRGAWAVVDESLDDLNEKLTHWQGPTIALDKIGRAVFKNASDEEAAQVRTAYDHYLDALDTTDVSSWLIQMAERCSAIRLRGGGGIYYIPPHRWPEWQNAIDALTAVHAEHHVYSIPTIRMTAQGARAILDCLTEEITQQIEKTQEEVISGDLGVKALETRYDGSLDLLRKVSEYEALLERPLQTLRDQIANLSTNVAAAKLAAEALRDEAS